MAQSEKLARTSDAMRKVEAAMAAVAALPPHSRDAVLGWAHGEYFGDGACPNSQDWEGKGWRDVGAVKGQEEARIDA